MTNLFTVEVGKKPIDNVSITYLDLFHRECGGKKLTSNSVLGGYRLSCDRCDTSILVPLTYNDKTQLIGVATKGLELKVEGEILSDIEKDKKVTVVFVQK